MLCRGVGIHVGLGSRSSASLLHLELGDRNAEFSFDLVPERLADYYVHSAAKNGDARLPTR